MPDIPLIGHTDLDSVFAYRAGVPVPVQRFLQEVGALARQLPEKRHVLNLCADRYSFAVGFCAALLRGQISLLPPNYTADFVARLAARFPDLYCLSDGAVELAGIQLAGIEVVAYPTAAELSAAEATGIPLIPAEQCAALVFTSGSTGEPTAHQKTWGSLSASATAEAERFGILPGAAMTILGTVPAQHMYGLESTVLIALCNGQVLVAERPFYPADISAQLAALPRPRCLVTTPIHLRSLLAEVAEVPPVDFVLCATAPLPLDLAQLAEACFGAPLYEIYGFTEAGQVASRRPVEGAAWTLFAGIALHQQQDRAWVSGGHVQIEAVLSDVIELAADGTFTLHGRAADLVNIGGKRTSLASLSHHLNNIPGVRDGVFMVPDDSAGGSPRTLAFVVAPGLTRDIVLAALRQCVDPVFLPRQLYFVESLPRNSTGKLTREALAQLLRQAPRTDRRKNAAA
ncbi:MAG: AMP-binding protein [Pseudomonadota bacterium]